MNQRTKRFVALLRGINVGGNNKVPMADLRALSTKMGWEDVETYIQSGNLVFNAGGTAASLETDLEKAIEKRFGIPIKVIVREGAELGAYVIGNPFSEACAIEPNLVQIGFSKTAPKKDAAEELQKRAAGGERIALIGDAVWIHYASGVAKSKLSPALVDRLVGSMVTARNWRTLLKIEEMARIGGAVNARGLPT